MEDTHDTQDETTPWSRDQIADGGPYNITVARLILDQGVLALQDLLDTKKQFESKAIALLAVFVPAAVGTIGGLILSKESLRFDLAWGLSGFLFSAASIALIWALRERPYGAPGIEPRQWLNERWLKPSQEGGVTLGDDGKASRLYAMLAHDLGDQIQHTESANLHKINLISAGIFFGIFAAVAALLGAGLEVFN